MQTQTRRIDPNKIKTRDYLMLKLISGATKAGTHTDKRKEASRTACRKNNHSNY